MKATALVAPLVVVLLVGCNDSNPAGRPAQSAPSADDYLKSAARSQKQAVKAVDIVAINKAVETFYFQVGRFPRTLEELVDKDIMRSIPLPPPGVKFNYDTNTGIVSIEKE